MISLRDRWLLDDDDVLSRDCHLDFHKSSGKGGQKVNKTSSAVRVTHIPSGRTVTCAESRSQTTNRHLAFKKLRMDIALNLRGTPDCKPCMEPPPSLSNKAYPLWVAQVFDRIDACGWDLKNSAGVLGVSRSKLTKLLRRDPALWREYQSRMREMQSEVPGEADNEEND